MGSTTTGSLLRQGLVKGLHPALIGSPSLPNINFVYGNPDTILTSVTGSDLASDPTNGKLYMSQVIGGSTWVYIGSVSAY